MLWAQSTTKDSIRAVYSFCRSLHPNIFFSNHNSNYIPNFGTQTQKDNNTCFRACLYSAGTQHRNLHQLSVPMSRVTYFILRAHTANTGKTRERLQKNCKWMDQKGRNHQGRNPCGAHRHGNAEGTDFVPWTHTAGSQGLLHLWWPQRLRNTGQGRGFVCHHTPEYTQLVSGFSCLCEDQGDLGVPETGENPRSATSPAMKNRRRYWGRNQPICISVSIHNYKQYHHTQVILV